MQPQYKYIDVQKGERKRTTVQHIRVKLERTGQQIEPRAQSSSSSSPSPPAAFLDAALRFFRLTRPGRPPPNGLVREKSMCFWESTRTRKDGMFTTCLPTLPKEEIVNSTQGMAAYHYEAEITLLSSIMLARGGAVHSSVSCLELHKTSMNFRVLKEST